MRIRRLKINNILSIGNAELTFGDSGLVLLDGWNYDDSSANGAGKTAILNCLAFGLYGKLPRKISASDILRHGTKSGFVELELEEQGVTYTVSRSRPNGLKFTIDGESKNMTQEEFESLIKLNYQQYLMSMYSAQTEGIKLISMNDTAKKDFFLQLLNLEAFSEHKSKCDAKIKELSTSINTNNLEIAKIESKISVYKESIQDEAVLRQKIEELDPESLLDKIKEYELIQKPDTSKYDELEKALKKELMNIVKREGEVSGLKVRLKQAKNELEKINSVNLRSDVNTIVCPHCDGKFELSDEEGEKHITLEELEANRKNTIETISREIKELVQNINDIETGSRSEIEDRLVKVNDKKSKEYEAYNKAVLAINDLKAKVSNRKLSIKGLQEKLDNNASIKENIRNLLNKVKILGSTVSSQEAEVQLYETISHIFSPIGAPAYIMDSMVETFNEKVAHYVSMIWPNASYSIQAFKENKSGDVKAKFSDKLIVGNLEKSIGMLSGGEYRCLSLAVDFTVIDILETILGTKLNPIMLDEPFNDLDASNRERVIDLLEKLSVDKQIWIVDHASESKAAFSNVVRVEKKDDVSTIA